MNTRKDIALTGFMGCGKTSVGKALAELLPEYILIDLDEYIESMTGKRIPDIFKEEGESVFRDLEAHALAKIFIGEKSREATGEGRRKIISLGGGAITTEPCRKLLKEYAICFYLKASSNTLVRNLLNDPADRPILNPDGHRMTENSLMERVGQLMTARAPLYESAADHIIPTDGLAPNQAATQILATLRLDT
ncbi:MAG: shikimate kinase [Bacteroidales bacterium]|nr:shikimate kinase [Bacteroidales bacterium]MDY6001671.1 shikimate kinase [Candidatus Cryptobacteroides sp.]